MAAKIIVVTYPKGTSTGGGYINLPQQGLAIEETVFLSEFMRDREPNQDHSRTEYKFELRQHHEGNGQNDCEANPIRRIVRVTRRDCISTSESRNILPGEVHERLTYRHLRQSANILYLDATYLWDAQAEQYVSATCEVASLDGLEGLVEFFRP